MALSDGEKNGKFASSFLKSFEWCSEQSKHAWLFNDTRRCFWRSLREYKKRHVAWILRNSTKHSRFNQDKLSPWKTSLSEIFWNTTFVDSPFNLRRLTSQLVEQAKHIPTQTRSKMWRKLRNRPRLIFIHKASRWNRNCCEERRKWKLKWP